MTDVTYFVDMIYFHQIFIWCGFGFVEDFCEQVALLILVVVPVVDR